MIVRNPPEFFGRVKMFEINCPWAGSTGLTASFVIKALTSSFICKTSFVLNLIGSGIYRCTGVTKKFMRIPRTVLRTNLLEVS